MKVYTFNFENKSQPKTPRILLFFMFFSLKSLFIGAKNCKVEEKSQLVTFETNFNAKIHI